MKPKKYSFIQMIVPLEVDKQTIDVKRFRKKTLLPTVRLQTH